MRPPSAAPAAVAAALVLLAGCTSMPSQDPTFAPVRPAAVPPPAPTAGAVYRPGYELVLFEDIRARRVGDILTIRLNEDTDAAKSADTAVDKAQDTNIANPTILGTGPELSLPGVLPLAAHRNLSLASTLGASREFEGEAESTQSNRLRGAISVTVAEVLPNGNLVVQGEKILTLNQGHEHIRISGIVRAEDVGPDNTVESTKVAHARIIYAGEGALADSNAMGWLARFFNHPVFPF